MITIYVDAAHAWTSKIAANENARDRVKEMVYRSDAELAIITIIRKHRTHAQGGA